MKINAFIKDWLIIGAFPNCETCSTDDYLHDSHCTGFYTDYLKSIGGEKNAIPTGGMQIEIADKKIKRNWSILKSKNNQIHFSELLHPKDMVIAYAFTQVNSQKDKKGFFFLRK